MYAVSEGKARINDVTVGTFEREVEEGSACLEVSAGTTGCTGSVSRWNGGRAYAGLNCVHGDFHFQLMQDEKGRNTGIELACCGDDSLRAVMKALGFILRVLEEQGLGVKD